MITKIVVIPEGDQFRLRTSIGFPIGKRLLTVAPESGQQYPDLTDTFADKLSADRAALRWNLYLNHAWKKRPKTKSRISE